MATMTDGDKVRALLPHWIEHNAEHAAEFRRWAERVFSSGEEGAAEEITLAAQELGWVNEALSAALEKLGGPLDGNEEPAAEQGQNVSASAR